MTQNIKKERTQEKTKSKKITKEDRETLTKYSLMPVNLEYIADLIGKNKGAVSREYRRVGMNRITYDAVKAQDDADQKRKIPRKENIIKTESDIEKVIIEKLKIRWSPEEIAEHCKTLNMKVSHETIYNFIYVQCKGTLKKELISYLRHKKKQRKNRKASKETRGSIPNIWSL